MSKDQLIQSKDEMITDLLKRVSIPTVPSPDPLAKPTPAVQPRVGQGPMRSGIFVGIAAGVFNLRISRIGTLPLRRQIKLKTLRSLFKITSDTPEHESEGSTLHRRGRRRCTPDFDRNSKRNQEARDCIVQTCVQGAKWHVTRYRTCTAQIR